jgi:probable HAF family extracellular repeat protein
MRRSLASVLAVAFIACGESSNPSAPAPALDASTAATPVRIDLGALGGVNGAAMDINASGVVVGGAEDASQVFHAFIWDAQNGMRALGELPGDFLSIAFAINDSGDVIGFSFSSQGIQTPVIWSQGGPPQALDIQLPGAIAISPVELNSRGDIVGAGAVGTSSVGFFWSAATGTIDLRQVISSCGVSAVGINDAGTVVGAYCVPATGVNHGFTWALGTQFQDVSLADGQKAVGLSDINEAGVSVGLVGTPIQPRPLMFKNGKMVPLPPFASSSPSGGAEAINDRGQMAGSVINPQSNLVQAALWSRSLTITSLNGTDPNASAATSINNAGSAVGTAFTSSGGFLATMWSPAGSGQGATRRAMTVGSPSAVGACIQRAGTSKLEVARCVTAGAGIAVR